MLPLLAAISESSGAAAPCLARACLQLKAKSRLAANKIAAGLQDVIAAHGGWSHCLFGLCCCCCVGISVCCNPF